MNPWSELYIQHRSARLAAGQDTAGQIRARLIELADRGVCCSTIRGRFTYERRRTKGLRRWHISGADEHGEPLNNLADMTETWLSVLMLESTRDNHIHQLTIAISGRTRSNDPICIAVHLSDDRETSNPDSDRQGTGACGHAAMHCHVGPTLAASPQVRVPMPPIDPRAALDWVLSQVVPDWEPASWPLVLHEIEEAENSARSG